MDDIIKSLKTLGGKHEEELSKIREKIRILDSIPKAKALVGKCFKYQGGFSFGSRRGWVYKHVVGVAGENLVVDTFQLETRNKFEFSFGDMEYVSRFSHSGFIPVSRKQYNKMFKKLIKHIAMLGKKRINGI